MQSDRREGTLDFSGRREGIKVEFFTINQTKIKGNTTGISSLRTGMI